jgi:CRP-like cAMP-binding protein
MESKDIERRFKGGEVIVERASPGRELFVVREGSVLLEPPDGGAPLLLEPGDSFGEAAPILGRPHTVRAVAEGDAVVLALDVPLLNRLCEKSPEFAVRLLRQLAQQVERAAGAPEITGSAALEDFSGSAPPRPVPSGPVRSPLAESERIFAAAILRCAQGEDLPLPVQGRLADLAREAGLEMPDAYACLQRLLDRHHLRLVDDQLSILAVDELKAIAG